MTALLTSNVRYSSVGSLENKHVFSQNSRACNNSPIKKKSYNSLSARSSQRRSFGAKYNEKINDGASGSHVLKNTIGRSFCKQGEVKRRQSCIVRGWFGGERTETAKVEESETVNEKEAEEKQKKKYSKLALSLLVDTVGLLVDKDFLEFDFAWPAIAAFLIQRMYRAPLLTSVGLVEQAIPVVKYLPTATIGWVIESVPQVQWISNLPFMGGLASVAQQQKPWWWPFGKKN